MSEGQKYNVLFLCTGNSARSIMAECILGRLGAAHFNAFSAGSQPRGHIHPYALDLLRKENYPTGNLRSKSWEEFAKYDAAKMDFVFTVCDTVANEACPVWPGQPMTAHWPVQDPAAQVGMEAQRRLAFAEAFRTLYARLSIFVSLPVSSLDKLTLKRRIVDIGQLASKENA